MRVETILAALAATCLATTAAAEPFTGTYQNGPVTMVMVSAKGEPAQGGAYWQGSTTAVSKSGATTKSTYTCVGWLTPGQATTNTAVCNAADNDTDKWSVQILCLVPDITDPSKPGTCWGAMIGTGGKYAGKTGQFVQYGTTVSGTSQGAWND
jgi:hypothetical protein